LVSTSSSWLGVKAEQVRPFEEVRNELAAELKKN
jgi:hypothetical protein